MITKENMTTVLVLRVPESSKGWVGVGTMPRQEQEAHVGQKQVPLVLPVLCLGVATPQAPQHAWWPVKGRQSSLGVSATDGLFPRQGGCCLALGTWRHS